MTNLVPLRSSDPEPGAGRRPAAWVRWLVVGLAAMAGLYWIQANPKLYPIALLHGQQGRFAALEQLSRDDPATPGENGGELERGERLSDHAIFGDWLGEGQPPGALTIGGAIAAERPLAVRRLAEEAAVQRQRAAEVAAWQAQVQANHDAEVERVRRETEVFNRQHAAAEAQAATAAAAQGKTVACNTARAHAYGTAVSAAAFVAWVRAHPCPEGTDIGDGYWNVAR